MQSIIFYNVHTKYLISSQKLCLLLSGKFNVWSEILPRSLRVVMADSASITESLPEELFSNYNLTALSLNGYNTNFKSYLWKRVDSSSLTTLSVAQNYILNNEIHWNFFKNILGFVNLYQLDISQVTSSSTFTPTSIDIHPWFLSDNLHILPAGIPRNISSTLPNLSVVIALRNTQIPFRSSQYFTKSLRYLDLSKFTAFSTRKCLDDLTSYGFDQLEYLLCNDCSLQCSFQCWSWWFPKATQVNFSYSKSLCLHSPSDPSPYNPDNTWQSLNLSGNMESADLKFDFQNAFPSLRELFLSNMKLRSANFSIPTNLTLLDLSENTDLIINEKLRDKLDAHSLLQQNFTLILNKTDGEKCSCEQEHYLKWLQDSAYIVTVSVCTNQSLTISDFLSEDVCRPLTPPGYDSAIIGKAVGISLTLLVLIIVALVIIKRHNWTIRIYLHRACHSVLTACYCGRRHLKVSHYIPNSIFISFCKHDPEQETLIHALYDCLRKNDLDITLLSSLDILPGEVTLDRLAHMIERSCCVVPLISNLEYFRDPITEYEIIYAIERREFSSIFCVVTEYQVLDGLKNRILSERLLENTHLIYPSDFEEESLIIFLNQLAAFLPNNTEDNATTLV